MYCVMTIIQCIARHLSSGGSSSRGRQATDGMRYAIHCVQKKTPALVFFYISLENDVTGSNEYLTFMLMEYFVHLKHSLKILCKSKHFPGRYRRKQEWVFFF